MRRLRQRLTVAASIAFAPWIGGCAGPSIVATATSSPVAPERELVATPFFPQSAHQCGPAALATVLGASGLATTPEALVPVVYVPELRGSLQLELLAASRRAGRIPYPVEPSLDALVAEIDAGRPVLVLQNLGLTMAPRWHYAVVVGYSAARDTFVLRSGKTEREVVDAARFSRKWSRAGGWGFVVLPPGEMPARAASDDYITAVAAFENAGNGAAVLPAWESALGRWPDSDLALFAFGNALMAAGESGAAEECYSALLDRVPAHVAARNNLALLLGERGCVSEARAVLEPAFATAADDARWMAILDESRAEIDARSEDRERCAASAVVPGESGWTSCAALDGAIDDAARLH